MGLRGQERPALIIRIVLVLSCSCYRECTPRLVLCLVSTILLPLTVAVLLFRSTVAVVPFHSNVANAADWQSCYGRMAKIEFDPIATEQQLRRNGGWQRQWRNRIFHVSNVILTAPT